MEKETKKQRQAREMLAQRRAQLEEQVFFYPYFLISVTTKRKLPFLFPYVQEKKIR